MQGLSAALLLSAGQLRPAAACYRQQGGSECSWQRRPQPPELNTNSPSRWPWAGSSQFHPPGRLQWPGPASARPEGERCRGDYSPFPVRHLSSARDTASSNPFCSLLPSTLDEPLPTAPPPLDGEAQRRQAALRPWWLQRKVARVEGMGHLESIADWASECRVGARERMHLRSEKSLDPPPSFLCSCSHLSADSLVLWRGFSKGPHHMGRLRNAKIHVERAVKVGGDRVVVATFTSFLYP